MINQASITNAAEAHGSSGLSDVWPVIKMLLHHRSYETKPVESYSNSSLRPVKSSLVTNHPQKNTIVHTLRNHTRGICMNNDCCYIWHVGVMPTGVHLHLLWGALVSLCLRTNRSLPFHNSVSLLQFQRADQSASVFLPRYVFQFGSLWVLSFLVKLFLESILTDASVKMASWDGWMWSPSAVIRVDATASEANSSTRTQRAFSEVPFGNYSV